MILIYGNFFSPEKEIYIESLGITIHPEKVENSVTQKALCSLRATVKIAGKDIDSLTDAIRRINVLLGAWVLIEWGNLGIDWWSYVTHEGSGGVISDMKKKNDELYVAIDSILQLRADVRQRIDAALYWLREPRNPHLQMYRSETLRMYSAYWNAFECLVEAVNIIQPLLKLSKSEKRKQINDFISQQQKCSGRITAGDIQKCYNEIVNPSFVGKAKHALKVCFPPDQASGYIDECFEREEKSERLYGGL